MEVTSCNQLDKDGLNERVRQQLEQLLARLRQTLSFEEVAFVERAFFFSAHAHRTQLRKSGEPYILHPLAVADILFSWGLFDADALAAALLHDVIEDTGIEKSTLEQVFNIEIAEMVDGLSKLEFMQFDSRLEAQAANFQKLLAAVARDVRVLIIKLADRSHNLQTLNAMRAEQRSRITQETLEVYVPFAKRLGMYRAFQTLEDLCFEHSHPKRNQVYRKAMQIGLESPQAQAINQTVRAALKKSLVEHGIAAKVLLQPKHLYALYRKAKKMNVPLKRLNSFYDIRILVEDVRSCYLALNAVHHTYKPIAGRFMDYIAAPKPNHYQALHTELYGPFAPLIQVQICSDEMYKFAEMGVLGHWYGLSGKNALKTAQEQSQSWIAELLEIDSIASSALESYQSVKQNLFVPKLRVFSPAGDVFNLPQDATPIDFAYAVHSALGDRCVGVKINSEFASLSRALHMGDRVEIITQEDAHPRLAWLKFVVTAKAKLSIQHYFSKLGQAECAALGEQLLKQVLGSVGVEDYTQLADAWQRVLAVLSLSLEELMVQIGQGKRSALEVAQRVLYVAQHENSLQEFNLHLSVGAPKSAKIIYAHCCAPISGDSIRGVIKVGLGLQVHRQGCPVLKKVERQYPEHTLELDWDEHSAEMEYTANLRVDMFERAGALAQVTACLHKLGINIVGINAQARDAHDPQKVGCLLSVSIHHIEQLEVAMAKLRQLPAVYGLQRL